MEREPAEKYEWIRSELRYGGLLTIRYKLIGLPPETLEHDEEVADSSEVSVRTLTRKLLGVQETDPVFVEVTYV